MSTLQQLREGLGQTWDSISDGWHQLHSRASDALTRFTPKQRKSSLETADEQFLRNSSRWGLLASEVQETTKDIHISLEAPGMLKDDFLIQVQEGNILLIHGEKRAQRESKQGHYHIMECAYGHFERAIPLPCEVDEASARASYQRGVLHITLPKAPAAISRRIQVVSE